MFCSQRIYPRGVCRAAKDCGLFFKTEYTEDAMNLRWERFKAATATVPFEEKDRLFLISLFIPAFASYESKSNEKGCWEFCHGHFPPPGETT